MANIVGGHNYCRNPDHKEGGIWCYTTSVEVIIAAFWTSPASLPHSSLLTTYFARLMRTHFRV